MSRFSTFTVGSQVLVLPNDLQYTPPEEPPVNYVDELVNAKLQKIRVLPSELCGNEVFLRRATLDVTGLLPTAEEFEQIESLVNKIDIEGGKIVHTVIIPEEVPAQSVAESINKLYGSTGAKDGIKAEAHMPTNTVLVYASEAEFEKINERVIQKISEVSPVGTLRFYKIALKYAVADEVARTLQEFFDKKAGLKSNQNSRFGGFFGGGRTTSAEKREDQVTIMAEPNSNMLDRKSVV